MDEGGRQKELALGPELADLALLALHLLFGGLEEDRDVAAQRFVGLRQLGHLDRSKA